MRKIEVIEYTQGYCFWQSTPQDRQLVILPEALPSSFSNTNKSTARETPKKLLTAQFFRNAAKTGLQIRAPVPPHLTAATFILHRAFKDDTLKTAVTVKLLRSFSRTHPSLNDLMQIATWIFMRRMCFTTCSLGCTDKRGPVKSDVLQHLWALCVRLGIKYEMDGTQSVKWMRESVQLWASTHGTMFLIPTLILKWVILSLLINQSHHGTCNLALFMIPLV